MLTDDELRSANAERKLKSEQIAGELQEIAKDAVKAESMLKNVNGPLLLALQNVAQSYNLVATKRALRAKAGTGDARPGETRDSKAKERWSGEAMEMLAEDKSAEAGSALFEKVSAFLESLSARTYEATEHLKFSHNPDLIEAIAVRLPRGGGGWVGGKRAGGRGNSVGNKNFGGSDLGCIDTEFAIKASCCSIFRDLQDLQTFAPLQSQNFQIFTKFSRF